MEITFGNRGVMNEYFLLDLNSSIVYIHDFAKDLIQDTQSK
ncbi:hypothetical protein Smp_146350 [Schistosoma mansoni]|uniref:Transcriptional regulator n=1 Tax=Schistosoma mansoni TaxID=6183 RepID=G4VBK8_SCHMA|nr:hypothetical protein Smp_146350 [Schistosoma mansoni]|eukprot:XP_018649906.1 hypothetical protein Smp_146350 [Schistosoma mansoni]